MNNSTPFSAGISPVPPSTGVKSPSVFDRPPFNKIPVPAKQLIARFYSNKKIFWPVSIALGLVFFVIILGLLFGNRGTTVVKPKVTPSPFIQATQAPCATSDALCTTGNQLKDLNTQINSLDLQQSRLSPPGFNFDITF